MLCGELCEFALWNEIISSRIKEPRMKGRSSRGGHRTLTHADKGADGNIFKRMSRKP